VQSGGVLARNYFWLELKDRKSTFGNMTGGFAILAYPAEYRNSGIMTFVIGKDGIVYQKDLGEKATDVASALADYNPGDGWTPAI